MIQFNVVIASLNIDELEAGFLKQFQDFIISLYTGSLTQWLLDGSGILLSASLNCLSTLWSRERRELGLKQVVNR